MASSGPTLIRGLIARAKSSLVGMVIDLLPPIRGLVFGLSGAFLAWLWFDVSKLLPVTLTVVVCLLVVVLQEWGRSLVTKRPRWALALMEVRFLGMAAAVAAAGATAIVIAVAIAPASTADDSLKQIITTLTAALGAFAAGIIAPADADGKIGAYAKAAFQKRFYREGATHVPGQVPLPKGSEAEYAVFTTHENNWTDWSLSIRWERINALTKHLEEVRSNGLVAAATDSAPQG